MLKSSFRYHICPFVYTPLATYVYYNNYTKLNKHLGLVGSHDRNLSISASGVFHILALYTVSQKNDTAFACFFDLHQPLLIIFWQECCQESMKSNGTLFFYLT